jgi:hypothetical protein
MNAFLVHARAQHCHSNSALSQNFPSTLAISSAHGKLCLFELCSTDVQVDAIL